MTPTEIMDMARARYNVVGDTFFSDTEILGYIYQGSMEMATDTFLMDRVFTTPAIIGVQEYDYPTNAVAIKRVTYDGIALQHVDFKELDALSGYQSSASSPGNPQCYAEFNEVFYLWPVPSDVLDIKVYAYVVPQQIIATSELDLPQQWHPALINFILREMSAKNKNYNGAQYYGNLWEADKIKARGFTRRKKRGDEFAVVQNYDNYFSESWLSL